MWGSSSIKVIFSLVLHATCFNVMVQAQSRTQPTTDANEAAALNSVFQQWGISPGRRNGWNIGGELCSGAAVGDTPTIDDPSYNYNPFIKCDCSYSNTTICHITALKVNGLDVEGVIPDELWTLTYLTNLNLGQNFLTGHLSESIGNLSRMQRLTLGFNSLSGTLPKSIGQLTNLRLFSIQSNNFSGPLPSELGSCTKLQLLYIDSSGVSGGIPKTFANLTEMVIMWASDNSLTGRIPDFIGNWRNLQTLRFEGNSFEGSIPSTFFNLTSLTELRISDLADGNLSLAFIKNMKSLTSLTLRDNNLFGSIPSDIGEYTNLLLLDLSFNNLSGPIPASLFNMNSLRYLFLGNNSLSGSLPSQKSPSLLNIDVSYNFLTGTIPSWVSEENLQINLVANNFIISRSSHRFLPPGWDCLQRNFPCYRGTPIYSHLAIKCGGPQVTSSNGMIYESDNETLGPATYYVTSTKRWAVSNVGFFTGSRNAPYIETVEILDSLFLSARYSASSLRYYGLGLENGNYTIKLQFTEIAIPDVNSWKSLGKRVFDIYIQGNLVLKNFDIREAAGGVSNRGVQRNFTVQITENYVEIHLFWAGKGTCCIPQIGTYGPFISAISATPDFRPTVRDKPPNSTRKKNRTGLIVGLVTGTPSFLLAFVLFIVFKAKRRQSTCEDEELQMIDSKAYIFSYSELKIATEDFSPANKLGEGGFGPVYKGRLGDGRLVAVKQLSMKSQQGKSQFIAEIATISAVQHCNLVELHGCCIEGDNRLLVYEYLENNSLDRALFGSKGKNLGWPTRYCICLGIARGLAYLHEESRIRIVHRDVKASNILLDSHFVPKISDFGLAKLYDKTKTHISTRVAGTIGYVAPEYAMRGRLTEKTDVFAFGIVALEIVSGRPNADMSLEEEKSYLLEWAWNLYESNQEVELVDSRLSDFNEEEAKRMIGVALLCTQNSPTLRPSMSRTVGMLCGDIEVDRVTVKPGYFTDLKADEVGTNTSEATSCGTGSSYNVSSDSMAVQKEHVSQPILLPNTM